ncbi:Anti-sigma-F factor antagonist RsfA [Nonomuraea coxensis DSM 45129]|uniref:Anti-sigma factor antagonist n=1 Tax=Nonomuraea coxensis DSM 45129 TaxID=1122611 RepID=A0ABX8U3U5_9ACTN|nr:STAS domain-containing protein [Nonomuraea coxensis]QYC41566.1 Anti-sigma-F factor antagonist RsfA [Nonomuraea coxensis DSM 45129]
MPLLDVHCRPLPTGVLITVTGELDVTNAAGLESLLERSAPPGEPVILDLGGLTFMDCGGLHLLLRLRDRLRSRAAGLHVAAVHGSPAFLLRITGVGRVLDLHPSVGQALVAVDGERLSRLRESS